MPDPQPTLRATLTSLRKRADLFQRFAGAHVRIWSGQWQQWWRPEASGYTSDFTEAGVYTFEDAWSRSSHCGPEKRIAYEVYADA